MCAHFRGNLPRPMRLAHGYPRRAHAHVCDERSHGVAKCTGQVLYYTNSGACKGAMVGKENSPQQSMANAHEMHHLRHDKINLAAQALVHITRVPSRRRPGVEDCGLPCGRAGDKVLVHLEGADRPRRNVEGGLPVHPQ